MVLLKKGCGCFQLKNFALVVGWLGCIQSVYGILQLVPDFFYGSNYAVVAIQLVLLGLQLGVCIELIRGVRRSEPRLVVPWLVYNAIALILLNAFSIFYIIYQFVSTTSAEEAKALVFPMELLSIFIFVMDAWWIYVWLCIYSLYHEQKNTDDKKLNCKLQIIA